MDSIPEEGCRMYAEVNPVYPTMACRVTVSPLLSVTTVVFIAWRFSWRGAASLTPQCFSVLSCRSNTLDAIM